MNLSASSSEYTKPDAPISFRITLSLARFSAIAQGYSFLLLAGAASPIDQADLSPSVPLTHTTAILF